MLVGLIIELIIKQVSKYKLGKAERYLNNKQYIEALNEIWNIPYLNEDIEGNKNSLIGTLFYYRQMYDDALIYLRKGADSKCDDAKKRAYAYIGCTYQKQGFYEAGISTIDQGIQAGWDEDATCFACKGACHFSLGQYEQALDAYRTALRLHESGDECTISEIEERVNTVKQKITEVTAEKERREAEKEMKKLPTHITIQGNNNPINLGGILATDDAVINRPTIQKEDGEEVITAFCPQCGCKVAAEDRFCRKCGGKLR